jgi:toxin CcdB
MPQFAVYKNKNAATRARFPLLLDVQSDLLDPLGTRVVVPLTAAGPARLRAMQTLTPLLAVEGKDYLMLTPQLAGVAVRDLGQIVANAAVQRGEIVAALDFLIYGI